MSKTAPESSPIDFFLIKITGNKVKGKALLPIDFEKLSLHL